MTNYERYEVEDFLLDDFFIQSVLDDDMASRSFWEKWILEHPGRRPVFEKARTIILSVSVEPLNEKMVDRNADAIIRNVEEQISQEPGRHWLKREIRIRPFVHFRLVAVLLVFIAVGFWFYMYNNRPDMAAKEKSSRGLLTAGNNSRENQLVRLSDSSIVLLKPGSVLKYPAVFGGAERNVYLEGEAFFEVHRNPQMPFKVNSGNLVTQVLGTSFTVEAFGRKKEFKVIVNTGKVVVYRKEKRPEAETRGVTLIPNQQVVFKRDVQQFSKEVLAEPLPLSEAVSGRELNFVRTPLSAIIDKLNEVYGVRIRYDRAQLGDIVLNAALSDLPLDEKVKLLSKAVNAQCSFENGQISIERPNIDN